MRRVVGYVLAIILSACASTPEKQNRSFPGDRDGLVQAASEVLADQDRKWLRMILIPDATSGGIPQWLPTEPGRYWFEADQVCYHPVVACRDRSDYLRIMVQWEDDVLLLEPFSETSAEEAARLAANSEVVVYVERLDFDRPQWSDAIRMLEDVGQDEFCASFRNYALRESRCISYAAIKSFEVVTRSKRPSPVETAFNVAQTAGLVTLFGLAAIIPRDD